MTMQFLFYYIRFHKKTPQVLIVSRNIQPRVEIRENPTIRHFCLFVCPENITISREN